jgi:hypothetical protein
MKMTIEIPEDLYKKTKIRAIECGLTLKQIVLNSLERELQVSALKQKPVTRIGRIASFFQNLQPPRRQEPIAPSLTIATSPI